MTDTPLLNMMFKGRFFPLTTGQLVFFRVAIFIDGHFTRSNLN